MNEFDDTVRTMLADRAAAVPASAGLLDGVHRHVRRRRTRRRALLGAATVVAVIAAGTLAWGVERDDRLVPADAPSESTSPAPSRKLVPGSPTVEPAPLGLGALPEGFPAVAPILDTKNSWFYGTTRGDGPSSTSLAVRISRTPLTPTEGPGTTRTIRIPRGPATLYTATYQQMKGVHDRGTTYGGAYAELTYRHSEGLWVRIEVGHNGQGEPLGVTEAQIVAVANGLTEHPTAVPEVLRFAAIPDGLVVGSVWAGFPQDRRIPMVEVQFFSPRAGQWTSNRTPQEHGTELGGPFTVTVGRADYVTPDPRSYPVRRTYRDGGTTITVSRTQPDRSPATYSAPFGGQVITVRVSDSLHLSDATMARFLAGVSPGKDFGQ